MPPRPVERPATPPAGTRRPLPTLAVAAGTQFFRLNLKRYTDPAYFGRGALHRFDAPDWSFGVCYLGTTLDCCVLEVLQPARRPRTAARVLTLAQLRDYFAAVCTITDLIDALSIGNRSWRIASDL